MSIFELSGIVQNRPRADKNVEPEMFFGTERSWDGTLFRKWNTFQMERGTKIENCVPSRRNAGTKLHGTRSKPCSEVCSRKCSIWNKFFSIFFQSTIFFISILRLGLLFKEQSQFGILKDSNFFFLKILIHKIYFFYFI